MPLIIPFVPRTGTSAVVSTMEEPRAALSGAQGVAPTIAAVEQDPVAALAGAQKQTGAMAVTVTRPTDALTGGQTQAGTMGVTVAKPVTALAGAQPFTATVTSTATPVKSSGAGVMGSFVTRDPATGFLMLDGQRFRFAGNNGEMAGLSESTTSYGETVTGGLHIMNHAAIDDYMDAAIAMEARVVRIFMSGLNVAGTFMPSTVGVYDHTALEGFDYAITQCVANDIRIIAVLVDDYDFALGGKFDWCQMSGVTPDGTASQFFSNATVIANFKNYINAELNHTNQYTGVKYKDDPVFLAWETGNEIEGASTAQALLDWTADIAQYIKVTVGAKQLVMDGKWGITNGTVVPQTHMNNQYIDIYTEHTYDQWRTPAFMANQASIAHNYGKAFVIGEYPLTGKNQGGSDIGWTNENMIAAVEANTNVDGDMFWSLSAQGNNHGGGFNTHYPGDDSAMISRVTNQKNHAIAMASGTLTNTPLKAATLVDTFTTLDTTKWTARNGATVSGGRASLPTSTTESALSSVNKYDLSNSSIIVELVTDNPGTGSSLCGMYVQDGQAPYSSNLMGFFVDGSTMKYRSITGGSVSDTTEAYSSVNHRWLRLRASQDATVLTAYPLSVGTVYWDVSSDGVNWVNKRSLTPGLALTSVNLILNNWNYSSDAGSGTALFDNFNNPSVVTTVTASISGTGRVGKVGSAAFTVTAGISGGTGAILYPSASLYPSTSTYPTSGA